MKKLLCVLSALDLVVTLLPLSAAGSLAESASYDELLPDYRQNMQTGETGRVYAYQFEAEKDGVYSVTAKAK